MTNGILTFSFIIISVKIKRSNKYFVIFFHDIIFYVYLSDSNMQHCQRKCRVDLRWYYLADKYRVRNLQLTIGGFPLMYNVCPISHATWSTILNITCSGIFFSFTNYQHISTCTCLCLCVCVLLYTPTSGI